MPLEAIPHLQDLVQEIRDYVGTPIRLMQDEIEDIYERLERQVREEKKTLSALLADREKRQQQIRQLSEPYELGPDERDVRGEESERSR